MNMKRPRNKLPLSPLKLCVSALIHTVFTVKYECTDTNAEEDDGMSKEAVLSFVVQLITNSNEGEYSTATGNAYSKITQVLREMDFGCHGQNIQEEFLRKFELTVTKMSDADGLFRFVRNIRFLLDFGGISTIQDKPIVK